MALTITLPQSPYSRSKLSLVSLGEPIPPREPKLVEIKQPFPIRCITSGKCIYPPKSILDYSGRKKAFKFKIPDMDIDRFYDKLPTYCNPSLWYNDKLKRLTLRVPIHYAKKMHRWLYKHRYWHDTRTNDWRLRKVHRRKKFSTTVRLEV